MQESLSGGAQIKHRAMTGWFRSGRHVINANVIYNIFNTCDVSHCLGELPHVLRQCVDGDSVGVATQLFFMAIDDFVQRHRSALRSYCTSCEYTLDDIAALFGTPCVLTVRNCTSADARAWIGATANVFKISFPKLGAEYALKLFRRDRSYSRHGPWYEIPTAFAAWRAEPRDNARVYLASLGRFKYMISEWMGEEQKGSNDPDEFMRPNAKEIFFTDDWEVRRDNWRNGRRIDFGKTCISTYGALSYRARKMYRRLINANILWGRRGVDGVVAYAAGHNANRELISAAKVIQTDGPTDLRPLMQEIISRVR